MGHMSFFFLVKALILMEHTLCEGVNPNGY